MLAQFDGICVLGLHIDLGWLPQPVAKAYPNLAAELRSAARAGLAELPPELVVIDVVSRGDLEKVDAFVVVDVGMAGSSAPTRLFGDLLVRVYRRACLPCRDANGLAQWAEVWDHRQWFSGRSRPREGLLSSLAALLHLLVIGFTGPDREEDPPWFPPQPTALSEWEGVIKSAEQEGVSPAEVQGVIWGLSERIARLFQGKS